jgi:hypothetical protein
MEIARHQFYVFDLDEQGSRLSFEWTERSAAMTVDDYKSAIREYARLILEHRVRRALVDLRHFRYRVDANLLGSWWQDEIVPVYARAGLEKFAFVLPTGDAAPPDDAPAEPQEGARFLTRQFGSADAAISWLSA